MFKWLQEHMRIILIVYIVEASIMAIVGLVLLLMYDFYFQAIFLIFLGLSQVFIGIWLLKRKGKGLLG